MGSDEMLEYEQTYKDELTEKFIEQNREKYDEFVNDEYTEHEAGKGDMIYDQMKDEIEDEMIKADFEADEINCQSHKL